MIDFEVIAQGIFEAAVNALGQGAIIVETRAKARAPVRQIFAGSSAGIRFKSIGEIEQNKAARSRIFRPIAKARGERYRYESVRTAKIATKAIPRRWHQRRTASADRLLAQYDAEMSRRRAGGVPQKTILSSRGASEVRTKRAKFSTWQHLHIGGRLRGQIYSTSPTVSGQFAEAWVISPTEYAKYQEFGTRHNAAHPFLRPARDESRPEVIAAIAAAVKEASRTKGSNTEIEIVVRL
jgi:HK97 gp10 family phage protein